jgi:hypothetical protein
VTTWTPAPGYTAEGLYLALKSHGTVGLIDPAGTNGPKVAPLEPGDCGFNGAYAEQDRCPGNRLYWQCLNCHPTVYMIDHTGPQWPVYQAAVVWDESTVMNVGYRWYTNGCPNSNCVDFWDADYGDTGWDGKTFFSYNTSTRRFISSGFHVDLNDHYSLNATQLQATACHEMGHAIGMDHNVYTTSCLYWQINTSVSNTPDSDDFSMLSQIYLHG